MIPAAEPAQRASGARLLVIDAGGRIVHTPRKAFVGLLRPGDLVVANDAATMPASLSGLHLPTGRPIEARLAGRRSLAMEDVHSFSAIVFGEGNFHIRTEERLAPPTLAPGDRLALGPLSATVTSILGHPRLVSIRFAGTPYSIWDGLARHGRPIQYAHISTPLALWDVWTPIAGPPVAFEPPSAGFAIDWQTLEQMRLNGIGFATITHAAGISSTGDVELDRRLPFDEPYRVPAVTAEAIRSTKALGGRIIAIGTTVVRALEHAGGDGTIRAGDGLATGRIDSTSRLRIVDAILSGTHEPGSSHYELLRAFADDPTLGAATAELDSAGYLTHEFGDSVFVERARPILPLAGFSRRDSLVEVVRPVAGHAQ